MYIMYNNLFIYCLNNPLESDLICNDIINNYNFNDECFLECLEQIFIRCHSSFRKLLSGILLRKRPAFSSEVVFRLYKLRVLAQYDVRYETRDMTYTDIDHPIIKRNHYTATILIYNRYDI